MHLLFDLDNTLIDSTIASEKRQQRDWQAVYRAIPSFTSYDNIIRDINSSHHQVFIITSSHITYARKVCEHWSIDFNGITAYHDTQQHKPHPEPFTRTLKQFNLDKDLCLSFGDRDIDVIASNEARIPSTACLWGAEDQQSLLASKPNYTLTNPGELLPFLDQF